MNLDHLKNKAAETTETAEETVAETTEEKRFQHYKCDRKSMQMRTHIGTLIAFVDHTFITDNEEVIDYLDSEISKGLRGVTKGELLTAKEADPMQRLREKFYKEFQEEQEAIKLKELRGQYRDMGSTEGSGTKALGAASSRTISDLADNSGA